MAIDYLARDFFTGLAIENKDKTERNIKTVLLISGILCLLGFFGTVFINENIWYAAPIRYGIGTMVISITNDEIPNS